MARIDHPDGRQVALLLDHRVPDENPRRPQARDPHLRITGARVADHPLRDTDQGDHMPE
ncbi:hypothetical protein [Streptomyces sp. NRRL S-1448]|uniref:hypothetical protein n=1 Tax=Streptomyces sp. NRRL S-1448 TaxID=1463883 RepID=UPI00131E32BA|nr:hypothetical protein [Streptomyces sp. NRRL S-1448]